MYTGSPARKRSPAFTLMWRSRKAWLQNCVMSPRTIPHTARTTRYSTGPKRPRATRQTTLEPTTRTAQSPGNVTPFEAGKRQFRVMYST